MRERNHLYGSSQYVKPGISYRNHLELENTIDLMTNIIIILLMGMITIMLVSFIISPPIIPTKRVKVNNKIDD
jgi:hypothetical protein